MVATLEWYLRQPMTERRIRAKFGRPRMSAAMSKAPTYDAKSESNLEINLKNPALAAFLAWLVPGLGHIYQGRTGKGVLFFVCILGTFIYGLYIGDGRVVYASTEDVFSRNFLNERWQYVCQLGVGLPAMPALIQRERVRNHKTPLFGSSLENRFMRPPYKIAPNGGGFESTDPSDKNHVIRHPDELAKWNYDQSESFEIGTVFTVIAGLLNILVIFDAYGGPLVIVEADPKKTAADDTESRRGKETK
jgi:hypothetical protein